jgi:hypothetical protein
MSARGLKFSTIQWPSSCPLWRGSDRRQRNGRPDDDRGRKAGISGYEISGEVKNVFEIIFEAMRRAREQAGTPDARQTRSGIGGN